MHILFGKFEQPIQRVAVTLSQNNFNISEIKLGLKSEQMIQMANHWKPPLWDGIEKPDVIICPLMKTRIPPELYKNVLTLVVHPGPPGDRGASALDWCVYLKESKWGVTVLEAAADYDAGNVWEEEIFDGEDDIVLRHNYGFGLRWFSPIGVLRFEFGYPIDPEEDQDGQQFHFDIGQLF